MVRRVPVTDDLRAVCTLPRLESESAFLATIPASSIPEATPEAMARAVFEGAPGPVRAFLRAGWRFGLGVHLGPFPSPDFVLGNRIVRSGTHSITVEMRGRLLIAQNVVTLQETALHWATFVCFPAALGRVLWSAAALVHHRTLPLLLRRAVG